MEQKPIKKILVIRFRQIGDTVLATAMCTSLKRSFPKSEIHIVLNKAISPLLEGHPDIDKVIPFTPQENKSFFSYLRKIHQVVSNEKYDVIIDMRSTIRTLFFSLFSIRTPFRIGWKKRYTLFLNRRITRSSEKSDMVQDNQRLADALKECSDIIPVNDFKLYLTDKERNEYRNYMINQGINFNLPVLLLGVTTKLEHKKWNIEYMQEVIKRILSSYKNIQLIFNYAPGAEEEDALNLYKALGEPDAIKIGIRAKSIRELMALCSNCSFYFGNEGGARHIVQALGIPSFAIFSPNGKKYKWLIKNSTPADGIDSTDILTTEQKGAMSEREQFNHITPDIVWSRLTSHLDKL